MITVWKWQLPPEWRVSGRFDLPMPAGAQIVRVALQFDEPCIWALVDPSAPIVHLSFVVVGTGQSAPGPDQGRYLGSFEQFGGKFIGHVFGDVA